MAANTKFIAKRITSGTNIIKAGVGTLASINVNKALAGTVTVIDGSTTIAVLTNGTTAPLGTVMYGGGSGGIVFQGLTITLSGTEDLTVCYE